VGRRGGLLKPSTGFAVDRILRDGEAIARSLRRRGHPHARPRSAGRHRWLDRVLLEVLDQDPASLEQAFSALFARNPPARVLRFLDEDTTVAQEAALIATLPRGPFLSAARRAAGRAGT
jgi:lycopene beta-cyclase